MLVVPIWPLVAVASATFFYVRHRQRVVPERRLPLVAFILAVVLCGAGAAFGGMLLGAQWACGRPDGGNLCGLVGALVTGPISGTLATIVVAWALSRIHAGDASAAQ